MRTRIIPVLFVTAVALAACGSKDPAPTVAAPVSQAPATTAAAPATAAATTAPATTAAAGGKLTLDLVKQQVGPVFAKDPDCPKGEWVTDKGNIDAKYRANVTDFGEYDCHLVDGEAIPHRVAQAVFLTFTDTKSANDYSDNELGMVPSLIDGTTVVAIGAGLKTVDMRKTLRGIENACSCGHVT
ncbi:hypothetical protein [Dactylosporangium sp. CA-139066]|uniref:hypothetical protein n=1 Tax=Dactylosporangium sp. CA-139066 TaxID=3239930 RepID=UPI003D8ED4B9